MSESEKGKEVEAPAAGFDFGLGSIFKTFDSILGAVAHLQEGVGEVQKTGQFAIKGLGEGARGLYGFSVRTLGEGERTRGSPRFQVRPFGNIRQTEGALAVEEVSEPIVDIFEESESIQVIVELPGVEERNIHYELKDKTLTISVANGRKYHKEIVLPCLVVAGEVKSNYRNGVLELRLTKP